MRTRFIPLLMPMLAAALAAGVCRAEPVVAPLGDGPAVAVEMVAAAEPVPAPQPQPDPVTRPAIVVTGDTEVAAGDQAVLRVSAPGATAFDWTATNHERRVFDPNDNGAYVSFATGTPGEYRWVVSVADGAIAKPVQVRIKVGQGPNPPPVVVTPTTPTDPATPATPATPPAEKPTAVAYVYEKDDTPVPPAVLSALNRINREKKVVATLFEADTKDGTGDVPEQYKAALAAAKEAGLPALVVTAGSKVVKVVKAPKDEQAVLDAVTQ